MPEVRKTMWETQHRMPVLMWMCHEMHPPTLQESLGPSNWRRLALDAEVGRYMPGVRR